MDNQNEIEIDVRELLYTLKKKLRLLISVTLICGVIGMLVSLFLLKPQYTASTRVYVLNRADEASILYSDFQTSNYILKDYQVLIGGQNVTKEVVERLDLDITYRELAGKLTITAEENTRVLQISVTDTDPARAAALADCIREVASEQIRDIMDTDALKTVYPADVPDRPSSPNVIVNSILAAIVGFLSVVAGCFLKCLLDDTISTEEEVEHYLGLSTLAIVPVSAELDISHSGAGKRSSDAGIRKTSKK